ncbi:MAG: Calcineurin-like phosphoesterase [Candidatus Izimaplasma bacterium HR2]|nr:MAG: Calcineurin-like phosphoesterase [Candidatus Izimaplasma bacterium HR2]
MKVLFIGDVFGTRGMEALNKYLPEIKQEHKPNLIFVNGENIDRGFGISEKIYKELMVMGVNAVTLGNHSFSKRELVDFIDESNIIRPANYSDAVPGKGYITVKYNTKLVTVINLMGRIFMGDPLDNPFKRADEILEEINSDFIFVDMHAEATSEKIAMAHYLDGRVTAVVGTHTHVPTADAMVFPKGTMYISDIGMTGAKYGILGADKEIIINKFLTGMPQRIKESLATELQFNAVIMDTVLNKIKAINIYE